jgi:hypothetical protein
VRVRVIWCDVRQWQLEGNPDSVSLMLPLCVLFTGGGPGPVLSVLLQRDDNILHCRICGQLWQQRQCVAVAAARWAWMRVH